MRLKLSEFQFPFCVFQQHKLHPSSSPIGGGHQGAMTPLRNARPPQVGAAMTPFPHFVKGDDTIDEVERLMRQHQIRHVPVQDEGRVVGIIS